MDPRREIIRHINETAAYLGAKSKIKPKIGIILGSGLSEIAEEISHQIFFPYGEIPHFPVTPNQEPKGSLVIGELGGKEVVAMTGRFHFYEGYTMWGITFPIRVFNKLGIEVLIVTNAAGGINPQLQVGDLMLITDHLNLMPAHPLTGLYAEELGERFLDLSEAYDKSLREKALTVAQALGIDLKEGVYAAISGPTYETPAEVRYLGSVGADAVGMSTVPEVIVAKQEGLRVLGISCIANVLRKKKAPLTHQLVLENVIQSRDKLARLIKEILEKM